MDQVLVALKAAATNPLLATLLTLVLTPLVATYFSLRAFRVQSKELLDAAVTWQWDQGYEGLSEEPYLVIQNRSSVPAFMVQARLLKGVLFRTEAVRYALSYTEVTDGNFPLTIGAAGVTSFPLSKSCADRAAANASSFAKLIGYVLKRPFLWVEVKTISGHRFLVPGNDVTSFHNRPLWVQGRWLPTPAPEWMKEKSKAL